MKWRPQMEKWTSPMHPWWWKQLKTYQICPKSDKIHYRPSWKLSCLELRVENPSPPCFPHSSCFIAQIRLTIGGLFCWNRNCSGGRVSGHNKPFKIDFFSFKTIIQKARQTLKILAKTLRTVSQSSSNQAHRPIRSDPISQSVHHSSMALYPEDPPTADSWYRRIALDRRITSLRLRGPGP